MEGPQDWDLLAVVRSCSSTTTTTTTNLDTSQQQQQQQQQQISSPIFQQIQPSTSSSSSILFGFSSPVNTTSFSSEVGQQELHDIWKPLICNTTYNNNNNNKNNISSSNRLQSMSCSSLTSPISQVIFGPSSNINTTTSRSGATPNSQRSKKRKNLMKKVCHVPAEGLSSDMWAWRKYGQKPIKGSPYPRGYYRCSSSKGCLARKQVEKNRTDPKMFIVTYTSEHNHPMPTHRNSLAGSTRQKATATTTTGTSSPTTANLSPLTELSETRLEGEDMIKDEEDNDMEGLSDMLLNDDFYVGFEQIDGGGSDDSDCFSEHFSPPSEFPWLSNGTTTATAAGGS